MRSKPVEKYFKDLYEKEKKVINSKLNNYFIYNAPKSLYDPCDYIMNNGGKRLRPILVLFSQIAVAGKVKKAYNAALAVEILHNFTLVHDDIMDNSDLRRGRKTVHLKYNQDTAILAGDNLIGVAYNSLLKDTDRFTKEVVNSFTKAIIEVCEGQSYDKEFETRKTVTLSEYLLMIRKKTAALLEACCEIGGFLGGGSKEEISALKKYGLNIGLAFQFQDDLLDIMGDQKKFGKPIGADLLEGKKTFIFLKALEKSKGNDNKALRKIIMNKGTTRKEIDFYREMYKRLGVIEDTEKEIAKYTKRALKAINILGNKNSIDMLTWLANSLIKRNF